MKIQQMQEGRPAGLPDMSMKSNHKPLPETKAAILLGAAGVGKTQLL